MHFCLFCLSVSHGWHYLQHHFHHKDCFQKFVVMTLPMRQEGDCHGNAPLWNFQTTNKEAIETKYGQLEVTPNMHLHSHLINCVVDYGPVHNF